MGEGVAVINHTISVGNYSLRAGDLQGTAQNMLQSYPKRGFTHQVSSKGAVSTQMGVQVVNP